MVRSLQLKVWSLQPKVRSLHQISDFAPNISYFASSLLGRGTAAAGLSRTQDDDVHAIVHQRGRSRQGCSPGLTRSLSLSDLPASGVGGIIWQSWWCIPVQEDSGGRLLSALLGVPPRQCLTLVERCWQQLSLWLWPWWWLRVLRRHLRDGCSCVLLSGRSHRGALLRPLCIG